MKAITKEKKDDKPEAPEKEEAESPAQAETSVPVSEPMPALCAPGNPLPVHSAQLGEHILPGSDSRYITESELYGLAKDHSQGCRADAVLLTAQLVSSHVLN